MINRKSRDEIKRMKHAGYIVALVHQKMKEVVVPGISTKELDEIAMKIIKENGFLVTCSCSHFMTYELFTQTISQAAKNVHRRLRQIEYRTQAPDHPILWSADESYYLKFYIFQVRNDI